MVRQADKTSTPPGLVFPDQSPIPIVEGGELLVLVTSCQATHNIHKHHWKQIMRYFDSNVMSSITNVSIVVGY